MLADRLSDEDLRKLVAPPYASRVYSYQDVRDLVAEVLTLRAELEAAKAVLRQSLDHLEVVLFSDESTWDDAGEFLDNTRAVLAGSGKEIGK